MVTLHRRRQWRDKRARREVSLADLMEVDFYIGVHIAITGFFFALLVMVVMFGDRFLNLFFGA
jgi:hypothetical protein